jgi:hypothetical protein
MLAFAGNSLLCGSRSGHGDRRGELHLDPARLGRLDPGHPAALARRRPTTGGSWPMAAMLFAYAAFFSFAYRDLTAATGALLLFGAVRSP